MALREIEHSTKADLVRQELVNLINLRHPLAQLAGKIDWQVCQARFGGLYAAGVGRPSHPIRLMVGLQLLVTPYDGHTLQACLDQAQRVSHVAPSEAYTDRG